MKRLVRVIVFLTIFTSLLGQMKIPSSGRLAGPLDSSISSFGDEFFNFPDFFEGKAEPGNTFLSGWLDFRFGEQDGEFVDFTFTFDTVGTPDGIVFPGGQTYVLLDNKAVSNSAFTSKGRVDINTGEVDKLELHALFQNSVIARVTRNIRIPFGFINDYPPVDLPIDLPFDDDPPVFEEAKFTFASDGTITGFEFHGETIAAVTLFPRLAIFPPYSFAENGTFYFANPTGCLPDAPPENCINDENNPDGVALASNAFFHPHFDLITDELRELPEADPTFSCLKSPTTSANGLVQSGNNLYFMGGDGLDGAAQEIEVYDLNTGQWSPGPMLPVPVAKAHSVVMDEQIYLMGGLLLDGSISSGLYVLDLDTGQWTTLTSPPIATYDGAVAAVGGELYFVGGARESITGDHLLSSVVEIYNPETDTWRLGSDAPLPVAGSSAVVRGSDIWVINGLVSQELVTNQTWLYNALNDSWSQGPPTVVGVYAASAGIADNRILVTGGRRRVDGPTISELQILDFDQGTWRKGIQAPLPTAAGAAAVIDNQLLVVGGEVSVGVDELAGSATAAVQVYGPSNGWTVCNSQPLFTSSTVLNSACGVAGPVDLSPGSLASILGFNFVDKSRLSPVVRRENSGYTSDLPKQLEGIRVTVDGRSAGILSVGPERVDFQIPIEVLASSQTRRKAVLRVYKNGSPQQAQSVQIPVRIASPAIFVFGYGALTEDVYLEKATALARNSDGSINNPSQPAAPEDVIKIFVTGLGPVSPALDSGQLPSGDPLHEVSFLPKVEIDGLTASVKSAYLEPQSVGVYVIEAVIPGGVSTGNNIQVITEVLGIKSNTTHISIR